MKAAKLTEESLKEAIEHFRDWEPNPTQRDTFIVCTPKQAEEIRDRYGESATALEIHYHCITGKWIEEAEHLKEIEKESLCAVISVVSKSDDFCPFFFSSFKD